MSVYLSEFVGMFCTIPAVRSIPANILTEVIGTFVLVYCVLTVGSNDLSKGLAPIGVARADSGDSP